MLSLVACLLLTFTFKPFFKEDVSKINISNYTVLVKNQSLQINFPENYAEKAIVPSDEQKEYIYNFIKSLKPVLSDDFTKTHSIYSPTSFDPDGIIFFNDSYLYRLRETGKLYYSNETVLVTKYKTTEDGLISIESAYYTSSYDFSDFFEWINKIDNQIVDYQFRFVK